MLWLLATRKIHSIIYLMYSGYLLFPDISLQVCAHTCHDISMEVRGQLQVVFLRKTNLFFRAMSLTGTWDSLHSLDLLARELRAATFPALTLYMIVGD